MASFVYNSTDELPEYFSSPIIGRKAVASPGGDSVKILEWPADAFKGITASASSTEPAISLTLPALAARPVPKLRLTFVPLLMPTPQSPNVLNTIFNHFGIPKEFVYEHQRAVTHSFGWQKEDDSTYEDPRHFHPRGTQRKTEEGTWLRSGIFFRWKQRGYAPNEDDKVDMVIISTHASMQRSFERLVPNPGWGQALQDPFCLLITVLDDLFRQVDTTIWKVLIVLRSVENVGHPLISSFAGKADATQTVLGSAETGAIGASFDFIAMYNIAKHIIHLKESSSAAYLTACEISEAHRQLMMQPERTDGARRVMEGVQALIQHKLTLLEGCKVRVESLDNRTQNMTNLVSNACLGLQNSHLDACHLEAY
ncbi:MAG: hypothetical protein Q9182_007268 [Xanthomendoza sp. 2 TL-2023]